MLKGEKNKMKFEELGLSNEILNTLEEIGYEETTTIQEETIPLILQGTDVIGLSQTGTGKTAAFGLPIIQNIDVYDKQVQAVIICPTRELVIQVAEELTKYSKRILGMRIVTVYGGQSMDRQLQALKKGAHIVVGTPGRMMDHLRRKTLKLGNVSTVILDEADEMLDMGFEQDVEKILEDVPAVHQTVLFSATMNDKIMKVTQKHLNNPVTIRLKCKSLTVDKIEQIGIEINGREKEKGTKIILDTYKPESSIIFCNTKIKVDELVEDLKYSGYKAEALHGDIKQNQRDKIIQRFKKKDFSILVATDVAARGIDVKNISLVLNYDLPKEEEYYVHRIGRTARNGEHGLAISFISPRDNRLLTNIEKFAKTKIDIKPLPEEKEIAKIKLNDLVQKVQDIINENEFEDYKALKILKENNETDKIAKALMKIILNDMPRKVLDNKENQAPKTNQGQRTNGAQRQNKNKGYNKNNSKSKNNNNNRNFRKNK